MLEEDRAQLAALVDELLAAEHAALAVMLFGSHARGDAGPFSDIDVRVFTAVPPRQRDRVRITPSAGRLVHWSIGSRTLAEKLAEIGDPAKWPWASAHYRDMQPLHDPFDLLRLLRAAVERARPQPSAYAGPALRQALEDLLEYLAKLKNAPFLPTDPDLLDAAWKVAHCCETLLRPLNPVAPLASEMEENRYLRNLSIAPPCWAEDRAICRGLTEAARPFAEVVAAARRISRGTVALLIAHVDALGLPDDLDGYLRTGGVAAYLDR